MSHERRGPFLGCCHTVTNDEGSRYFPAVLGAEGFGMKGGTSPFQGEKSHDLTHPFTCHTIPPLTYTQLRTRRETVESLGEAMLLTHTLGVAQETGTQGQRKRRNSPHESQALPRAAPQPRGEAGELRGGVRSTSTRTQPGFPRSTGRGGSSLHG